MAAHKPPSMMPPTDPYDARRRRLEADAHNEEVIRRMRESGRAVYRPPPSGEEAMPEEFEFKITNSPIPLDALRAMRSRNSRARYRKAPLPGERLTLDAALYHALWQGRWRLRGDKIKRREQSDAAIRILADVMPREGPSRSWAPQVYVDAVTEEHLLAVVERSVEQGLSAVAVKFRLSCLSQLGVKPAALMWLNDAAVKTLITNAP